MKARRAISRFFAAAFVIVVMQQIAAIPVVRTSARIECRAEKTSASLQCEQSLPSKIIAAVRYLSIESTGSTRTEDPLLSGWLLALSRFQRPPPAA